VILMCATAEHDGHGPLFFPYLLPPGTLILETRGDWHRLVGNGDVGRPSCDAGRCIDIAPALPGA
jgi:hypothetical protein